VRGYRAAMEIEVRGSGAAGAWPEPGCGCASCRRAADEGVRHAPFHVLVDGKLELSAAGPRPGLGLGPALGGYQVRELAGGWDVTGPDGARLLAGARPEVAAGTGRYDAALLDLGRDPVQLGRLRAQGAVDDGTLVLAGFVGHQVRSERELDRRCRMWRAVVPRDGDTFSVSPATSDAQLSAVSADGRIRSSTPRIQVDSVSAVVVMAASTSAFFSPAVCSAWPSRFRTLAASVAAASAWPSAFEWASISSPACRAAIVRSREACRRRAVSRSAKC